MFRIMKEYHKKFNNLNKLETRTKDNEQRKKEVLNNVGDIYNELYDIYLRHSLCAKDKKSSITNN